MRKRRLFATVVVAVFAIALLQWVPKQAAAEELWEGYLPTDDILVEQILSDRVTDSSGRAELSLTANIAYITTPTEYNKYYEIGIYCSALSDTWGKVGYYAPSFGSADYTYSQSYGIWGDDEGKWIDFHDNFYFPYYGKWYDRVYVSSNGFVTFDQRAVAGTSTTWTRPTPDTMLPDADDPDAVIAPWWRDLQGGGIYYGRCSYGALWDSFGIFWFNMKDKGYDNKAQRFGLVFETTYDLYGKVTGSVKFIYESITMPYKVVNKVKVYMPTGVGHEDQAGARGQYIWARDSRIANGQVAVITPYADNAYGVSTIKVSAEKMSESLTNDAMATIDCTGTYDELPGGQNIGSIDPSLDPYSPEDDTWTYYATDAGMILLSYVPVVGQLMDAGGLLRDAAGMLGYYSPTPSASLHDAARTVSTAYSLNTGNDEIVSDTLPGRRPYDVHVAPVFKWRLWTVDAVGNPVDLKAFDHYLYIDAELAFGVPGSTTTTIPTSTLFFKINKDPMSVLWSDDFDDGYITDWTVVKAGTGVVAPVTTPPSYDGYWSLHIQHAGYLNYARATSPAVASWDTSKDYRVGFALYVVDPKYNVVYNDGRIRVISSFYPDPETGLGTPYLLASQPTGETPIMQLPLNEWLEVELRWIHGSYQVLVNGADYGYYLDYDTTSTKNSITIGSNDPAGSRDSGNVYWDSFEIIGFPK